VRPSAPKQVELEGVA